jgi:two-component system, OmpR family, response regulator
MDNKESEQLQILIAESDSDLLTLFKEYLSSLGVKTETATSGQEAIEQFLKSKENKRPYNAIVLDTHLQNPSGLDVAKKIRSEKPDQKVVIITTMPRKYLPEEYLKNARIENKYTLSIPFNLSKLANVLKN